MEKEYMYQFSTVKNKEVRFHHTQIDNTRYKNKTKQNKKQKIKSKRHSFYGIIEIWLQRQVAYTIHTEIRQWKKSKSNFKIELRP